jgi:hypothetical protein
LVISITKGLSAATSGLTEKTLKIVIIFSSKLSTFTMKLCNNQPGQELPTPFLQPHEWEFGDKDFLYPV